MSSQELIPAGGVRRRKCLERGTPPRFLSLHALLSWSGSTNLPARIAQTDGPAAELGIDPVKHIHPALTPWIRCREEIRLLLLAADQVSETHASALVELPSLHQGLRQPAGGAGRHGA